MQELENSLSDEQRRRNDADKNVRKLDKRIKELIMQVEDERKAQQSMADQNNALHGKIKLFKQQLEEAVSTCLFVVKYRWVPLCSNKLNSKLAFFRSILKITLLSLMC